MFFSDDFTHPSSILQISAAAERWGIEDFPLKDLRMRGNKSPHPQVLTAPRGGELNPQGIKPYRRLTPNKISIFIGLGYFLSA
jgi:hypothetical protein